MSEKKCVLFLCTGNSCRSQMAEGLALHYWGDRYEFCSAGIEKHGLNPLAVKTMQEIAIDIADHNSKTLNDLTDVRIDYVITVCGHADETCPVLPGSVVRLHAGFDDPPKLAAAARTDDEALPHYRRVRDEIAEFVKQLPEKLHS